MTPTATGAVWTAMRLALLLTLALLVAACGATRTNQPRDRTQRPCYDHLVGDKPERTCTSFATIKCSRQQAARCGALP